MREFVDARCLRGWVFGWDGTQVGEDITLQETAFGTGGWDLGDFGLGDALFMEELDDGWVERVGGVLGLDCGGRCKALNSC